MYVKYKHIFSLDFSSSKTHFYIQLCTFLVKSVGYSSGIYSGSEIEILFYTILYVLSQHVRYYFVQTS